ncbi:MAG TPA: ribosome biogenesis GTPase Der [Gemmatimonadales bacterium]|jgi:GTP-binding protein|nr:ribosome biogenesis GTPase Der [Gemmatimonadales bacterium]
MSKPTVAIVGRPNVGKSTLFNRILGGRAAIVSEHAGTTRDRHFGDAEWAGRTFWLVDTGGLVPDSNVTMDRAIRQQVDLALAEADLILFVVDGREGLNPVDTAVAEKLRRAKRPVLLAVNKLDQGGDSVHAHEFHRLGFGDPQAVSATVGTRSGDLLDAIIAKLPPATDEEKEPTVDIAIVGRPNAGKSSLANRLLGEERYVVDSVAGTTRDAVDSILRHEGKVIRFIDTAGLRRQAKVEDDVEFYSTLRTKRAIEQAAVCILVVDAALGLHNQDLRIATEAWEQGAGLVIAVNKWDLIEEKDANTAKRGEEQLILKAPFLQYVPFVYISSLTGQRTRKVLDVALEVAEAREHRINTAEVNKVLEALIQRQQPPQKQGEEVKLVYASQIGTSPPAFAIVSNRPDDVPESYQRYLMHGFRSAWGFTGAPVRLKFSMKSGRR